MRGLDCDVFVGESTVRYLEPVWTDFESQARLADGADWATFVNTLAARGRARIEVTCRVPGTGEKPAATLLARFVAKRRSADAV
jgi:thioesterase domain-containing protein